MYVAKTSPSNAHYASPSIPKLKNVLVLTRLFTEQCKMLQNGLHHKFYTLFVNIKDRKGAGARGHSNSIDRVHALLVHIFILLLCGIMLLAF